MPAIAWARIEALFQQLSLVWELRLTLPSATEALSRPHELLLFTFFPPAMNNPEQLPGDGVTGGGLENKCAGSRCFLTYPSTSPSCLGTGHLLLQPLGGPALPTPDHPLILPST
jgi:hypothetical protein